MNSQKYIIFQDNHEKIENLNRQISSKESDTEIKNLPTNKSPWPNGTTGEFYKTVKEDLTPILFKLFQKTEEEENLNTFYEASITLILKPDKDVTKKTKKIYRSISLINTDKKILNKTLANGVQQYSKRIIHQIHHNQVGFIPWSQGWFKIHKSINVIHHKNKRKDKYHMIILIDAEKHLTKVNIPL